MKFPLLAVSCLVVLAAGCAPAEKPGEASAAAPSGKQCFWPSQVSGFNDVRGSELGSNRIVVSVGVNDRYLFETFGSCPDLNYAENIGFDQHGPGQICRGIDVTLLVPGVTGIQRCPVRMIRKLTDEEAKVLMTRPK